MTWQGAALRSVSRTVGRFRWTFGVPIATVLLPATIYAVSLPEEFTAGAIVRVREIRDTTLGDLLPEERAVPAAALVAGAKDRLMAGENLTEVIRILLPGASPDDPTLGQRVRARLEYQKLSSYSFLVTARDGSPVRASDAVNRLLKDFLLNEARGPRERARASVQGYRLQVAQIQEIYDKASVELQAFRRANERVLPEAHEGLRGQLDRLKAEISWHEQVARSAKSRAEFLEEQLARSGASPTGPGAVVPRDSEVPALMARLREAEQKLAEAERRLALERVKGTDEWPSVKAALRDRELALEEERVSRAALEAARAAERVPDPGAASPPAAPSPAGAAQEPSAIQVLRAMLGAAREEARISEEKIQALLKERDEVSDRLAQIPFTESRLRALEEPVAQARSRLTAVMLRLDRATEMLEALIRADDPDVSPYVVEQWAVPPVDPSGPARLRILLTALAIGAGLGYGVLLLRKRFHRHAVASAEDLMGLVGGAMVVTVPLLPSGTPQRRRLAIATMDLVCGAWVTLCLGLSAVVFAAYRGWVPMPGFLRSFLDLVG